MQLLSVSRNEIHEIDVCVFTPVLRPPEMRTYLVEGVTNMGRREAFVNTRMPRCSKCGTSADKTAVTW